jgi:hypothetical protein
MSVIDNEVTVAVHRNIRFNPHESDNFGSKLIDGLNDTILPALALDELC